MRRPRRTIYWSNIFIASFGMSIALLIIIAHKNYRCEITEYLVEDYIEYVVKKEKPEIQVEHIQYPKRKKFDRIIVKKRSFWSNEYKYYVEILSELKNYSETEAVGNVSQFIETIGHGILKGDIYKVKIPSNGKVVLRTNVFLPNGKHTKMVSGIYFGISIKINQIDVRRAISRCRWISRKKDCYSFSAGCIQLGIDELDSRCDKSEILLADISNKAGVVNTRHTGLNLRSKPAYTDIELTQETIIVEMKKASSVYVTEVDNRLAMINGKKGHWYKLTYVDDFNATYKGYAFGPNIKLTSLQN